jgi:hypothetical protein
MEHAKRRPALPIAVSAAATDPPAKRDPRHRQIDQLCAKAVAQHGDNACLRVMVTMSFSVQLDPDVIRKTLRSEPPEKAEASIRGFLVEEARHIIEASDDDPANLDSYEIYEAGSI